MSESVLRECRRAFCGNVGERFAGMSESVLRECREPMTAW